MTKLHISISVAGRYGGCRISSSVRGLMSKRHLQLPLVSPQEIAPRHNLNRGRVIANLWAAANPLQRRPRSPLHESVAPQRPHRIKRLLSRPQMMFSPKPLTPSFEDPLLDHKAKSRKQQQAEDNSLECCFVDPSEQDDTDSRSGSQSGQSNPEIDQNL